MTTAYLALGAVAVLATVNARATHRVLLIAWAFATALCVCFAVAFDRTVDGLVRRLTGHASLLRPVPVVSRRGPRRHHLVR